MERGKILAELKDDIKECRDRHDADISHLFFSDSWDEYWKNSSLWKDYMAYKETGYEKWVLIPSDLTGKQRDLVIQLESEMHQISFDLMDILEQFTDRAGNATYTDGEVFSAFLGAMEYAEEYFDHKTRIKYARFGNMLLSGDIKQRHVSSWPIELRSERGFFLDRLSNARMLILSFLIGAENSARYLEGMDLDTQIDTEAMGRLKYRSSTCSIEFIYNEDMIKQGVADYMKIMGWEEDPELD